MATYQSIQLPHTVIDNSNWRSFVNDPVVNGQRMSRGYSRRDWSANPLYCTSAPFPLPLIPKEEWVERIREREAKGWTNRQIRQYHNLQSLNQNGTNYCWINGVVQAVHYLALKTGEPKILLSPASGGAVIKQGQNVGGWGDQAIRYIMDYGLAPQAIWPANEIRNWRHLNNEQCQQIKLQNRITGFYELKTGQNGWTELVSALLYGFAIPVAYNWWSHLVCAIDAVIVNGEICILIDNSWGSGWGENGLGVIKGSKKYASEAHAVISKTSPRDDIVEIRRRQQLRVPQTLIP